MIELPDDDSHVGVHADGAFKTNASTIAETNAVQDIGGCRNALGLCSRSMVKLWNLNL